MTIVEPLQASVPDVYLISQTVSLSLCVTLGELGFFAGKDDLKRFSDVYNNVIKHLSPTNARQAIWHAGQVYRIVKSMPKGSLVGFCTTCLYFAALTFWMYSNVYSTMSLCLDTQQRSKEGHLFVLDSQVDSPALGRFILSRLGFPALNSKEGPAYLNNSAAVLRLFQKCYGHSIPTVLFIHRHGLCITRVLLLETELVVIRVVERQWRFFDLSKERTYEICNTR